MTRGKRQQWGDNGFTLMELLISITIFAVVISLVYGAYQVTFKTVSSAENQAIADATGRIILERISEDLAVVATDNEGMLEGKRGGSGDRRADSLSCIAYAHLDFSRNGKSGGRAMIAYSTVENEDGLFDLYRSDTLVVPGQKEEDHGRGELLARNLLDFQLTYVTGDKTESEEWDSTPDNGGATGDQQDIELPALVRIEILLAMSVDDEEGFYMRTSIALPARPKAEGPEG